ncbi:MAG: PEGA domain-containing protein [Candidatus Levybacteria bacterium]|nr:PEGA domain-containing protein [Candidatus Levybacteria bacterium]
MKKQLLISLAIFSFLVFSTTAVILYGTGYRFELGGQGQPTVSKTGLLVSTSTPDGAQVFINGNLTTATNNTLNLKPGEYRVQIVKEGYFPWEKVLTIQEKIVTKAEALLFPITPKLEGITTLGVEGPILDPSRSRIAYRVATQSAQKNGIYVLDMNTLFVLTLQSASKQITDNSFDIFSKARLSWTPDGQSIIATTSGLLQTSTTYLLRSQSLNAPPRNITNSHTALEQSWLLEIDEKERARRAGLKSALQNMIAQNFNILSWSPDETKILYEASTSATLPLIIKPRLIGIDTKREERTIAPEKIYVYDIKEDFNVKLLDTLAAGPASLTWFPDSKHLILVEDKIINIMDYDGSNKKTVYAGPFEDNFVFPWPNGSRLVILTSLGNQNTPANLYTISLK